MPASRSSSARRSTWPGRTSQPGAFQASLHYQANIAVQRDIGFNTVVEVAYVGNWGRHYYQGKTVNNIPVDAYANPANLFNNDAISANFIRRNFAGMGALTYVTSDYTGLDYNSLQVSVQRRLSHGLQMGGSYTLAKGHGHARLGLPDRRAGWHGRAQGDLLRAADGRRTRARIAATWRSSTTATRSPRSTSLC